MLKSTCTLFVTYQDYDDLNETTRDKIVRNIVILRVGSSDVNKDVSRGKNGTRMPTLLCKRQNLFAFHLHLKLWRLKEIPAFRNVVREIKLYFV